MIYMYLKFLLGFMSLHIASTSLVNEKIYKERRCLGEICSAISTNFEPVRERGRLPSPHMTASIYDCIIIVIAMTSKMHVSRVHVVRSWTMDV